MKEPADQPRIGDAFGQILIRCWEAGAVPGAAFEVVERDDGYLEAHDANGYFAELVDWSSVERWGCEATVGRVLDIGCGAGRHAVELQSTGTDITGVDPSPGAVRVARERGIPVIAGTIADVPPDGGPFDTFLAMGNNLGLIGPGEAGRRFLTDLAALAAPGALLIGSGIDPYGTTTPEHLAYHQRNRERDRLPGHVRIRVRHRAVASSWFDYVLRSPEE
ncbi:MAG: class I SAM-dependent methyltransferase, partial [Thermocrispum sp.]